MSAVAALTGEYVSNLTDYLLASQADKDGSEEKTAAKFASEYVKAIRKGYNATIMNKLHLTMTDPPTRETAYKNTLLAAMQTAKADISNTGAVARGTLETAFMAAAIAFWAGAMLEGKFNGMPIGHVNLIPPVVCIFPGAFTSPIIIPPNSPSNPPLLPGILGAAYAAHLSTLIFLVPLMLLPSPAPPYPLPIMGFL